MGDLRDRAERCKPYPELAEASAPAPGPPVPGVPAPRTAAPGPFRIHDTRAARGPVPEGMVDLVGRRMFVPLVPRGRAVARHELGHVRWSPRELPDSDVDRGVLLCVEDARVNLALARAGVPVELDPRGRAQVLALAAEDVAERRWVALVLRAVAAVGTSVERELRAAAGAPRAVAELVTRVARRTRRRLADAARRRGRPEAPFATAERLARELERELRALGLEVAGALPTLRCLACAGPDGEAADPGDPLARLPARDEEPVGPGALRTVVAPLTVPVGAPRAAARAWRAAEEGSVVRGVHRLALDGRVFRRAARRRAGTVLVDTSGSMSFGAGDLARLLREASAATQVALYSGRGAEGELRVVARDGRRAAAEHLVPFGGGNVVDVPALEWLARQPPPRVWLSDGRVTGVGDRSSPAVRRACERLRRRARIVRVAKVEQVARALGGVR